MELGEAASMALVRAESYGQRFTTFVELNKVIKLRHVLCINRVALIMFCDTACAQNMSTPTFCAAARILTSL